MRVTGGHFKKYFQIIGGNFKRWVEFSNCKVDDWFYIHRSSFEYGIQIHSGKYGHLNIWQCENLKDVFMSNRFGTTIELGQLSISSNSPLKVFSEDVVIHEIDFRRKIINKDIQLLFSNCQIRNILFDQFVNFGYISFTNISPNFKIQDLGKILIKNSNLGKIDFVNCNLNEYEIDFLNSRINEISIIGGNFDKRINSPINKNEINTQEKLFYGQLKKSFENIGNLPLSIDANANFMEAHLKSIKNEESNYSYKNAIEYFNIWLNKVSNQHGKSTSVALTSLILVSIYLYSIFCISLSINKKLMEFTFNNSILFASGYLEFINPLHKLDSILEIFKISKTNNLSKFLDVSSKLIISYFIYQFIQAFRKYRN